MNECYYILLLFLNLIPPSSSSDENILSLPNITIQHVCENEILFLKCTHSNETIQIIRSMYGRTSQRICNQHPTPRVFEKTCANIEQSKTQTKSHCHGKSTCQILIDNQLFTDPCGWNIPKHFEIHYRCFNQEEICSKLFFNCSKSKDLKCIEKIQEEFACRCPLTICRYVNHQLVGFIENFCPDEYLQGLHWPKTIINKRQYLSCPSPCTGTIDRFCHSHSQWSEANSNNCQCPIERFDQLSTHRSATSYVFQCNFWLINRILPEENSCILSFTNWRKSLDDDNSFNCLRSAFEQMTFQSCLTMKSFGIDFNNLAFEIYIPWKNESQFRLFTRIQSKEILIDRTDIIKENFRTNLPMMIIENKNLFNSNKQSFTLIEQENDLNSIQTANVTVIFHHQSSEVRYQCRAYHSTNFSLHLDSTNMFFACQLLCSNYTHVICQCPFFNPFMHYVLHIDMSRSENEILIENDLNNQCSKVKNNSIDHYLKDISSLNFAKKYLLLINRMIEKETLFFHWNILQQLTYRLINITHSFVSINNHIELFLQTNEFHLENSDRSVMISIMTKEIENRDFQVILFTLSNLNIHQLLNSPIVHLNFFPRNLSIDHIQISFRHLNISNQIPTCVHFNINEKNEIQWNTDGCQLLSTNLTHSICSCQKFNALALLKDFQKPIIKSNETRLLLISKIGCIISIVCILSTIILSIIMRSHLDLSDDLTTARNILHTNMLLCLLIVEFCFFFGIDPNKTQIGCRIISLTFDYFLLATFSWMFVDGIELFIALKHVYKIDRIRLIAYSLYSYGFPLLILFLSVTFSAKHENSISQYCWLSHDNAFIWAFVIPFTLSVFGNICFFIISICQKLNSTDDINQIRFFLRNVSLISMLFGVTWIIGLFYLYDQTFLLVYLFTLCNSFHGFLIFLFYCFFQKHIRNSLENFHFYPKHSISLFHCFIKTNSNSNPRKSLEHFSLPDNTSSSDYSSGHSSDINPKQLLSNPTRNFDHQILYRNHYERKILSTNETCYLPSVPINLLTNRLSTFRYPLSPNEMKISQEQNEQLLGKNPIPEDEHQYYEIG